MQKLIRGVIFAGVSDCNSSLFFQGANLVNLFDLQKIIWLQRSGSKTFSGFFIVQVVVFCQLATTMQEIGSIKKIIFFIFAIFISVQSLFSSPITERVQISLLTCGAGEEMYSAYGHSAIRILDKDQGFDIIYNYGVFDFNTPNFYLKFAQGKLLYYLAIENTENFIDAYKYEGRSVFEQVLNLDSLQLTTLIFLLDENYQPENRAYLYDFFYDNCSTRIREIVQKAMGNTFKWDLREGEQKYTFRQCIKTFHKGHSWGDFGIDLCLGLPCDKIADKYNQMFLPNVLSESFQNASFIVANSEKKPFVKVAQWINPPQQLFTAEHWFTPIIMNSLIALFLLSIIFIKNTSIQLSADILLFGITGLLGLLFLLLWFATDHKATVWNFNLLWALPNNLAALFYLKNNSKGKIYFLFVAFLNSLLLVFGWLLPQDLNLAVYPIILVLAVRSFIIYKRKTLIKT